MGFQEASVSLGGNMGLIYTKNIKAFNCIPKFNFAYWVNNNTLSLFDRGTIKEECVNISEGIKTGCNERFIKEWWEVLGYQIYPAAQYKYVFHHMGGLTRKWYGNRNEVIFWENDGELIKAQRNSGIQGSNIFFKTFLSFGKSGNNFSIRSYTNQLFDSASPSILPSDHYEFIFGLLNSKLSLYFKSFLNPSLSFQVGDVGSIPLVICPEREDEVCNWVKINYMISKNEYDSFETSWDFKKHPLV